MIPMSGSGKRFRDAGYTDPKPLIRVDDLPMIEHVVSLFPGVTNVTFICNTDDLDNTNMRETLLGICPTATIVAIAPHKKGPVWAVAQAFDKIDDHQQVIVSYCDYGTDWDFESFLSKYENNGRAAGVIACYRGFHPHMLGSDNYAFCKVDAWDGDIVEIREKQPFTDDKMSEYASNGTYYFVAGFVLKKYFQKLIDLDININGEYYVSLVYNLMIKDGLRVEVFEIDKMLQWGTPHDLETYKGWSRHFGRQNFTLVLPMAGKGERFRQAGYTTSKPFLPVDGLPMVVRAARCLPEPRHAIFIGLQEHMGPSRVLEEHFPGAHFTFLPDVTEGQAMTCKIGMRAWGVSEDQSVLISACDNAATYDQKRFLEMMDYSTNDFIVWSFTNHLTGKINSNMYSCLDVDG